MKRIRHLQQQFSDPIKNEPRDENAESELHDLQRAAPPSAGLRFFCGTRDLPQTIGAPHLAFVFDDAFAAEKMSASGARGNGFAKRMAEAALAGKGRHL